MVRESKEERFCRLAEARVNKIIKMLRLLGNCSNEMVYAHTPEQVDQIFTVLRRELDLAQARYRQSSSPKHKRFSLSDSPERTGFEQNLLLFPGVNVSMPDGTVIRAVAFSSGDYPAINIYRMGKTGDIYEKLCFVEFNPEKEDGRRICIGTYCSEQDDTTYYSSYEVREENEES